MSRRSRARQLAKADRAAPGARETLLTPQTIRDLAARGPTGRAAVQPNNDDQNGAGWMGPQNPISPMAPPEVAGRQFDYPVGYNLVTRPRAYEPVSFFEMRAVADAYDVLRLVIETRKDQVQRLDWSIQARTLANGTKATVSDADIQEITDFFEYPDGVTEWGTWLSMLLEEMFVCDAAALYPNRTYGGQLLGLEPIDGTTFKRVIDVWGRTPQVPAPAYQQVLKGLPAVDYTADDLIYVPRNPRVSRVYGYSPVEQIVTTVNIALRRQLSTLDYFTEGSVPEAIMLTPEDWSPSTIAEFAKIWEVRLSGALDQRRKLNFVPGGKGAQFIPIKPPDLSGKFDEWLARIVCYAFSVPPTPFIAQVNRATAESAHDAALEEGLAPIQRWIKRRIMDPVLRRFWPNVRVEFAWADDREVDAAVQEAVITGFVTKGIYSINEGRELLDRPPVEGGDKPMVLTANGYQPIDAPPPPEPAPTGALPPHQGAPDAPPKPGPGEPPAASTTPKPGEEAQAAKAARTFRPRKIQKAYWGPPRRAHPPHRGGDPSGSAPLP